MMLSGFLDAIWNVLTLGVFDYPLMAIALLGGAMAIWGIAVARGWKSVTAEYDPADEAFYESESMSTLGSGKDAEATHTA